MRSALRIALLTHSTNPRGGVSHCLSLAEALCRLGHEAVVHAPDPKRAGFYRPAACGLVSVPAEPLREPGLGALVVQRIDDYRAYFEQPQHRGFDLYHAHDGIGGNALADLAQAGLIPGFARTVHHLDSFADPRVAERQIRAVRAARAVFCVSDLWVERLRQDYGIRAHRVANGIDRSAFSPEPASDDAAVRQALGLGAGPLFLAIGGFEARKNTAALLEAFAALRRSQPEAQLAIVGGASLLDHADYAARCRALMVEHCLDSGRAVVATGPVAQSAMAALYRGATALVFPSLNEGFGLVVIEAMACGLPVITSNIAPFTEYLSPTDALLVDPRDTSAITGAMLSLLQPEPRRGLIAAGLAVAKRFDWSHSAERHVALYHQLGLLEEAAHA